MSLVSATTGTTIIITDAIELCIVRIIRTISTLLIAVLIVGIPSQSLYYISSSFSYELHTFPLKLRRVFRNERQWIIITRPITPAPRAIFILYRKCRIEIVHCIQDRTSLIVHWYALMLSIHGIQTSREVQMILEHLGTYQRAEVDTVHICSLDNTLTIVIVQRSHIGCLLATTIDGEVMVMANASTQDFLLPIGRRTIIVSIIYIIGSHITTNIIG